MQAERASFTARRVASQRARLSRPSTPDGNVDAERRLYAALDSPLLFSWLDAHRMDARTRWFDDATVEAIDRGVEQVVIVGAGYDGRALRFGGGTVRWIEVDHPATQADKRRRLAELGVPLSHIAFVAVDLIEGDLESELDTARQDATQPTLFLCEGLLGYLPVETIRSLLTILRKRSTDGSALAVNFRVLDPPKTLPDRIGRQAVDGILALVGEHRRTEFRSGDPESLLIDAGWRVVRQEIGGRMRVDGGSRGLQILAAPGALPE